MAYFLECPHCDALMPRAHASCPSCGLSFEESMRRSDLPESERPPKAIYIRENTDFLSNDQKFSIGLCFCTAFVTLAFGKWLPGILLLALGSFITPATQERLQLTKQKFRAIIGITLLGTLFSFWY